MIVNVTDKWFDRKSYHVKFSVLCFCLLLLTQSLLAVTGQNTNAVIKVDMIASTTAVDTLLETPTTGQDFSVAVIAENLTSLKGFSVVMTIDTAKFTYVSNALSGTGRTNILGSPISFTTPGAPDASTTELELVAASSAPTMSTSGLLGIFTFHSKLAYGQLAIVEIQSAQLTDKNNNLNTILSDSLRSGRYSAVLPQYNLTVSSAVGGSVFPTGSLTVNAGVATQITATPDNGAVFVKWAVTGNAAIGDSLSASTTIILLSNNASVTAIFDRPTSVGMAMRSTPKVCDLWYANGRIGFAIPGSTENNNSSVRILIYDMGGKLLNQIQGNKYAAGYYSIDLKEFTMLPPGLLICVMKGADFNRSVKFFNTRCVLPGSVSN